MANSTVVVKGPHGYYIKHLNAPAMPLHMMENGGGVKFKLDAQQPLLVKDTQERILEVHFDKVIIKVVDTEQPDVVLEQVEVNDNSALWFFTGSVAIQ